MSKEYSLSKILISTFVILVVAFSGVFYLPTSPAYASEFDFGTHIIERSAYDSDGKYKGGGETRVPYAWEKEWSEEKEIYTPGSSWAGCFEAKPSKGGKRTYEDLDGNSIPGGVNHKIVLSSECGGLVVDRGVIGENVPDTTEFILLNGGSPGDRKTYNEVRKEIINSCTPDTFESSRSTLKYFKYTTTTGYATTKKVKSDNDLLDGFTIYTSKYPKSPSSNSADTLEVKYLESSNRGLSTGKAKVNSSGQFTSAVPSGKSIAKPRTRSTVPGPQDPSGANRYFKFQGILPDDFDPVVVINFDKEEDCYYDYTFEATAKCLVKATKTFTQYADKDGFLATPKQIKGSSGKATEEILFDFGKKYINNDAWLEANKVVRLEGDPVKYIQAYNPNTTLYQVASRAGDQAAEWVNEANFESMKYTDVLNDCVSAGTQAVELDEWISTGAYAYDVEVEYVEMKVNVHFYIDASGNRNKFRVPGKSTYVGDGYGYASVAAASNNSYYLNLFEGIVKTQQITKAYNFTCKNNWELVKFNNISQLLNAVRSEGGSQYAISRENCGAPTETETEVPVCNVPTAVSGGDTEETTNTNGNVSIARDNSPIRISWSADAIATSGKKQAVVPGSGVWLKKENSNKPVRWVDGIQSAETRFVRTGSPWNANGLTYKNNENNFSFTYKKSKTEEVNLFDGSTTPIPLTGPKTIAVTEGGIKYTNGSTITEWFDNNLTEVGLTANNSFRVKANWASDLEDPTVLTPEIKFGVKYKGSVPTPGQLLITVDNKGETDIEFLDGKTSNTFEFDVVVYCAGQPAKINVLQGSSTEVTP